jgi:hypothetical protein
VVGESGSIRDLEYVLWEVRVTVLLAFRHWKLRALDLWTVPPSPPADQEAERLQQEIEHAEHQTDFQA